MIRESVPVEACRIRDKNARPNWQMVRLHQDTHRHLKEWIDAQAKGNGRGIETDFYMKCAGEVTFDAAVSELLRRDTDHRARGRKAKPSRKLKPVVPVVDAWIEEESKTPT